MATKDFEAMGTVSEDIPVLDWNAKIEDTGSDDEAFSLFRLLPEGDYDLRWMTWSIQTPSPEKTWW